LLLGLVSCASPISKNLRAEASKDLTFRQVFQNPEAYAGAKVIWGGKIVNTINEPSKTEIAVLEMPLDHAEKPHSEESSQGRFIVRTAGFLDPAIYRRGREITVAGKIAGKETRPLGKLRYTYPVVDVQEIHLWKKADNWFQAYPYGGDSYWGYPRFDPFWYGPYPFPPDLDEDREEQHDRS